LVYLSGNRATSPRRCSQPAMASKSNSRSSPCTATMIFRCRNMVQPSLSQKCSHVAFVTRLPDQLCAASCATTSARLLSPASSVGVTKVRHGFSMPPYGKLGGRHSRSYRAHAYGWPVAASAATRNSSTWENSNATASTTDGSDHARQRGEMSRDSSSPTASAKRYDEMGTGCENA